MQEDRDRQKNIHASRDGNRKRAPKKGRHSTAQAWQSRWQTEMPEKEAVGSGRRIRMEERLKWATGTVT